MMNKSNSAILLFVALGLFVACGGEDGATGQSGAPGIGGGAGPAGPAGPGAAGADAGTDGPTNTPPTNIVYQATNMASGNTVIAYKYDAAGQRTLLPNQPPQFTAVRTARAN